MIRARLKCYRPDPAFYRMNAHSSKAAVSAGRKWSAMHHGSCNFHSCRYAIEDNPSGYIRCNLQQVGMINEILVRAEQSCSELTGNGAPDFFQFVHITAFYHQ